MDVNGWGAIAILPLPGEIPGSSTEPPKPSEPYGKFALLKRHALYMIRAISSAARVGLSRKLL
jgi:hypothetical protein